MKKSINPEPSPRIKLGETQLKYEKTGIAHLVHDECHITGKKTFCVEIDTSDHEEFGPMRVSIKYILEMLDKMPPVQISRIDLEEFDRKEEIRRNREIENLREQNARMQKLLDDIDGKIIPPGH